MITNKLPLVDDAIQGVDINQHEAICEYSETIQAKTISMKQNMNVCIIGGGEKIARSGN
jgi:hypothetical protein